MPAPDAIASRTSELHRAPASAGREQPPESGGPSFADVLAARLREAGERAEDATGRPGAGAAPAEAPAIPGVEAPHEPLPPLHGESSAAPATPVVEVVVRKPGLASHPAPGVEAVLPTSPKVPASEPLSPAPRGGVSRATWPRDVGMRGAGETVHLRVSTEELGPVRVAIRVAGDALRARFVSSTAQAARSIQGGLASLMETLTAVGFPLPELVVRVAPGQARESRDRDGGWRSGRREARAEGTEESGGGGASQLNRMA